MERNAVIGICVVFFAVIAVAVVIWRRRKNKEIPVSDKRDEGFPETYPAEQIISKEPEFSICFEALSALTEDEENRLVEVHHKTLLARIDGIISGTLQSGVNAVVIHDYQNAVKSAGNLYQAIIPKDAMLAHSKVMENAVRGFSQGSHGIEKHANFIPMDGHMGDGLVAANVANTAMGVAALVVGQYYMTQVNHRLDSIANGMDKIAGFQDNEYRSKIYALVAEIQKCSAFQVEIMENDELRNRELSHLGYLEHECIQLLGQANLTLEDYAGKTGLDYKQYDTYVREAENWYCYQKVLLEIMGKIAELQYALNLGAISKGNCFAMCSSYVKQSNVALEKLREWHKENSERHEVDVLSGKRKRKGFERIVMSIPAFFNDELHYKSISERTAEMIRRQTDSIAEIRPGNDSDLFREDVRLVVRDGKLYYLPSA